MIVTPLLVAWRQLREQIAVFDKSILAIVRTSPVCRLLMSVPGIGVLSVLAYVSTIEDPARFSSSRSVGAHLGLTPRQYQSGEVDRSGRISRCGDSLARTLMYEAAVVILTRIKRELPLKSWALAIARKCGSGKARVALARKLSVILHAVWRSGEPFRAASLKPRHELRARFTSVHRRLPPGAKVQMTAAVAVEPHQRRARCGPCSACASNQMLQRRAADCGENRDPEQQTTECEARRKRSSPRSNQRAVVLGRIKAKPSVAAEKRPALTRPARVGV